jgi:hypothetical protein
MHDLGEAQQNRSQIELLSGAIQHRGLERLVITINEGVQPSTAIALGGEIIAREQGVSDVDGTCWALAALAFAAGLAPESEVLRWAPPHEAQPPPQDYPPQGSSPPTGAPGSHGHEGGGGGQYPRPAPVGKRSKSSMIIAVVALVVLALGVSGVWWLIASTGDRYDEAAYCDAYQSASTDLSDADLTQMNNVTFSEIKTQLVELREKSPPELEDEWNTIANGFDELENLLADAGLSIDDLSLIGQGQLPDGVDQESLQQLLTQFQQFTEENDIEGATDAIAQDAEERCDIPAGGEPS